MDDTHSTEMHSVMFSLNNQMFAVSSGSVLEMSVMPKTYPLPESPEHVRGVINLRDQIIPVIDLRSMLGMKLLETELEELELVLDQRKKDHIEWLTELKRCVDEQREFRLSTDPHQCAFGRWYDTFTPNSQTLSFYLKKFDAPHRRIHAVAFDVQKHIQADCMDAANTVIKRTEKGELREMINLFEGLGEVLKETIREIALILAINGQRVAFSVDSVVSVGKLTGLKGVEQYEEMHLLTKTDKVAEIEENGKHTIVQILDAAELVDSGRYNCPEQPR